MVSIVNGTVFTLPAPVLEGVRTDSVRLPLLANGTWYTSDAAETGLHYHFPAGTLTESHVLTADFLLDGTEAARFVIALYEGGRARCFQFGFALINQCSARMVIPLDSVHQQRWAYERSAAWLKPYTMGDRVNLAHVDTLRLFISRKGDEPVTWVMTPLTVSSAPPPALNAPMLPKGHLLDELGQSMIREWEGKSRSAEQVTARLHEQVAAAPHVQPPARVDRWGGWMAKTFQATGFFRTHHDQTRWWLVTPDGNAFWSSGLDCVVPMIDTACTGLEMALEWLPEQHGKYAPAFNTFDQHRQGSFSYLTANLIRAFGDDWYAAWQTVAFAYMKQAGFNTVGNWSDWHAAKSAGVPYVRPLYFESSRPIFRDFPDVYDPAFATEAAAYAEALRDTRDDPALIGYFLMNEPEWGFASDNVAAGMLYSTETCGSRRAFADWLRAKYGHETALNRAWNAGITFAAVEAGIWHDHPTPEMMPDLEAFSAVLVERYFGTLTAACKAVDPNHLNLGARYYTVPPNWALDGMRHFDVFSLNCYDVRVNPALESISSRLNRPILIGEWHFGALDAGLPASGIGRVRDQAARGQAIRIYIEDAAAKPWCVGVHYFTLYDQSALGRFDGENYNIGLVDTCHRPYPAITTAARTTHERLYPVASGDLPPFDDAPDYLPRLFY
ncbi:MAG: hypothetical protein SF162_02970 [bacterium]|nr:hypothetical protein [bacterium]